MSILCSTLLGVIFSYFGKNRIKNLHAIIINYFVCIIVGGLVNGDMPIASNFWEKEYFFFAIGTGILFIGGFNLVAIVTQKLGLTVAAILQKMSILLSVLFAFYCYNEIVTIPKIIGLVLAAISIVLSSWQSSEKETKTKDSWLVLTLLALGTWGIAGCIEIVLQYCELKVLDQSGDPQFLALLFGSAGVYGMLFLLFNPKQKLSGFTRKEIVGGIILGIVNFGSMYFLMRSLGNGWEGSVVFPINNVGIILASALISVLFVGEKLNRIKIIGLLMAILSIYCIAFL